MVGEVRTTLADIAATWLTMAQAQGKESRPQPMNCSSDTSAGAFSGSAADTFTDTRLPFVDGC
jgi:hypothetical protein